jgi:uncharacterized alkaline shock family protein YloU
MSTTATATATASGVDPTLEAASKPRPLAEPGDRGDLTIGAGVVEKIAQRAALDVPGVGDVVSRGRARLFGGGGASADVTFGPAPGSSPGSDPRPGTSPGPAGTARIELTLTVLYPAPAGQTSQAVRRRVVERVRALTGLAVQRVDITVTELENEPGRSPSGRVL